MRRAALRLMLSWSVCASPVWAAGLGPWTEQTSTNGPRTNHALAASGRYVYAIGGGDNLGTGITPAFGSVSFAEVNEDGTLSAWATTTPLQTPRYNVSAVGVGGRLYVVGGWSSSGCCGSTVHYKSTEIGAVNGDGTIGSWVAGPDLVEGAGHGAVVTDGAHIFHVAGFGDLGGTAAVQVADLNPDGSLSAWRLTTALPAPREGPSAVIAADRIYVFGGFAPPVVNTVVSAPILPDGEIGAWRNEAAMAADRYHAVALAGRTKVFVGGGSFGTNACLNQWATFEEAAIGPDGILDPWVPSSPMNFPRYGHAATVTGRTVVVAAGTVGNCAPQASTETATCLDCLACGDGVVDSGESCDDGNTMSDDGCSASCQLEATPTPTATTSPTATTTSTPTATPTSTPSPTATTTDTPTATLTATETATSTPTSTHTPTPTPVETSTVVPTATSTPTAFACSAVPEPGCRVPAESRKAFLYLRNRTPDDKDQLVWKWLKGTATTKADFGDPTVGTSYLLCIYDGMQSLRVSAAAPAGGTCVGVACWKEQRQGFKYVDKDLSPDGLAKVELKAGVDEKAQIMVFGKGTNLALPPLPITSMPVIVQLKGSAGECWEATYTSSLRNLRDEFKAKADLGAY